MKTNQRNEKPPPIHHRAYGLCQRVLVIEHAKLHAPALTSKMPKA